MNILLINPPLADNTIGLRNIARIEPLSLELVGAGVSKEHTVRLVDLIARPDDLENVLTDFIPDVVGITSEIVRVSTSIKVLRDIRSRFPHALTVIGGCHPTLCPEDYYDDALDAIVIGEGVDAFREICKAKESQEPLDKILGLHVRLKEGWKITPHRPILESLDSQPLPDRSLTDRYRSDYFYLFEPNVAAIRTSFGCSFPCIFCSVRVYSQTKFVPRSAKLVFEEISRVKEDFIMFCDDHSFHNPDRMWELGNMLLEAGIKKRYFAYARTDCIAANKELFRLWAKVGLTLVMTGLEALDQKTLRKTGKRTDLEVNEQAVKILGDLGIGLSAGFLVNPDFQKQDFKNIVRYYKKHPNILLAEFTPLTPFPGTPLYRVMKKDLLTHEHALFDLQHFVTKTTLPTKKLYQLMLKSYAHVFMRVIRTIIRTKPRIIFSRHMMRVFLGLLKNQAHFRKAHMHVVNINASETAPLLSAQGSMA